MAALNYVAVALALAGCAAARPQAPSNSRAGGDDVTLYRDGAIVRQELALTLPAGPSTATVTLARGVTSDQLRVIDPGGLTITAVHAPSGDRTPTAGSATDEPLDEQIDLDDEGFAEDGDAPPDEEPAAEAQVAPAATSPRRPRATAVQLDVVAPRAGTYRVQLGYPTPHLQWEAAYTLIASLARDRGELRGALAIRNDTGIAIRAARARVIDDNFERWRARTAEHLAAELVDAPPSSTLPATPRELGALELRPGESRIELVREPARRIRSVLVYDPIGTQLDHPGAVPLRDPAVGTRPRPSSRVTESFEVARDLKHNAGLPAGPVRMLAHRSDGTLGVVGEARLFDAATRVSDVDTITIGTAEDVTGTRERRELSIDEDHRRIVEEFAITLHNERPHPVEVLVREHLYRGQNWTLAYHSVPEAAKEGPQQISLRTQVPARSKTKIVYVVVYTWGP